MKKPTGKPGDLLDRHFRCLAIERRIQDRANATILGIRSAESSHKSEDGSKESNDDDDDDGAVAAAGVGGVGGPPADIHFNNPENEDDVVDDEVAAANNAGEMNAAVARGEDVARDCRQSLPLLNRASSAVSAAASQGGGGSKSTAPRRSPSLFVVESGGEGGQKTKNSSNRDRVSLSKSIQRVAESLETAGGGGESGMMVSMLSMQMQQQAQQFSMQQQMFQQQMQMQMAAIERRAEASEKYLCRIAKAVSNKRKRGESDGDDGSSGYDE